MRASLSNRRLPPKNTCSRHGICANGKCSCDAGYTGDDCSLGPFFGAQQDCSDPAAFGTAQCRALRRSIDRRASGAGSAKNSAGLEEQQQQQQQQSWATLRLDLDLVVVSPFTRTIQTAFLGLGRADTPGAPPFVATELARERIGPYTCDAHRPLTDLRRDFPGVDFSRVPGGTRGTRHTLRPPPLQNER